MKRTAQTFFVVLLFASTVFGATQRYIVVTKTPMAVAGARALMKSIDASPQTIETNRHIRAFGIVNGFAADMTSDEAAALKSASNVSYVSPVVERHALDVGPAESLTDVANPFAQVVPYGIDLVHAREVWPVSHGEGINVVIVDTGIDYTHPELSAVYAGGFNELTQTNDPKDDNGHGKHVAGTIAAADNNIGVVGIAPRVKLWSVKVLDSSGSGSSENIIAALDWVTQQKAKLGGDWVLNFSLGSSTPDVTERSAFTRAASSGLLICAASGNDSQAGAPAPVGYPAAYSGVFAIGAIDSTKAIATFSNQGPSLGAVAPGVSVLSTFPIGTGESAGVSMSNTGIPAKPLQGSAKGTVTGHFVYCGYGTQSEIPASVAGNIALIQRGNNVFFYDKAKNAKEAGATAVLIFNNGGDFSAGFTLTSSDPAAAWTQTYDFPLTVIVDTNDGATIGNNPNATVTVTDGPSDYEVLSGTSMATPHATGVAALVWSVAPQMSSSDVIAALEANADDLCAQGFDTVFGNGLVDALAAAKAVAPDKFGNPSTTPPPPPARKTHAVRHH